MLTRAVVSRRRAEVPAIAVASFAVAGLATVLLASDQGGYFQRTWAPAAIAFAAVAAVALLVIDDLRTRRADLVLVGGLAALTAWTACSAIWSLEQPTSLREAVRTPVYLAAALALVTLAAAGGSTGIVLGVAAGAMGIAAYSLLERLVNGVHPGDVQGTLLERPLGYANALGVLCAIGLVIVVALALEVPRLWPATVAPAAILALALVLTQSRGSFVAATAGLGLVLAARLGGRRWAAAVAAGAGLVLGIASVVSAFSTPAALQARGHYWNAAWHLAREHPLAGGGAGTWDLAWGAFGDPVTWGYALDAHSLYVESLAELGVVGLLLLGALLAPLAAGLRSLHRTPAATAALGGALVYLVHAGLDWDWEMPAVTVAGLACLVATGGREGARVRVGPRWRTAGLALALATIVAYGVYLAA